MKKYYTKNKICRRCFFLSTCILILTMCSDYDGSGLATPPPVAGSHTTRQADMNARGQTRTRSSTIGLALKYGGNQNRANHQEPQERQVQVEDARRTPVNALHAPVGVVGRIKSWPTCIPRAYCPWLLQSTYIFTCVMCNGSDWPARNTATQGLTLGPGWGTGGEETRSSDRQTWRGDVDADGTERMTRGRLEREETKTDAWRFARWRPTCQEGSQARGSNRSCAAASGGGHAAFSWMYSALAQTQWKHVIIPTNEVILTVLPKSQCYPTLNFRYELIPIYALWNEHIANLYCDVSLDP